MGLAVKVRPARSIGEADLCPLDVPPLEAPGWPCHGAGQRERAWGPDQGKSGWGLSRGRDLGVASNGGLKTREEGNRPETRMKGGRHELLGEVVGQGHREGSSPSLQALSGARAGQLVLVAC